ncbi:TPA: tyrosine--tRNA ligase [candidate division CPR2 bacterium]|uniref:Tyrosine--tRNA ligase n=1 Tax=candidate division CPR2 bacterium GW2011_GWC1_41_48 TaxID=1618344 RepID=A0A0G0W770_UNCC2|nr:MAG: Tyrosine-tRNA ligase [candidate division CPR2 bacterium GW2011_GWC2_39_35]KKR28657.1 MAG: Tyrosine-tRNA ligase [candidate division CPR2 bacterium GW2011_GWD2_39_7]KKS08810.1 MAG: Tyrosyl-tRNA synthetase [candidate division CPR2 bacterium GW2011_GWC1_41_48]OGB72960.1 MAG: tyrosine--tRNA ligase [candidate division CPR2 bacterium GWD2_39_7]HBG81295.1 tyrosine--tRNA ligase [candidate division CPR2 bacterium]
MNNELLIRGIEEIYTKKELETWLKEGKSLRIYLGVDPSGDILHLGHSVPLRKLRDFQRLGAKIIFLIGDFTGMIGDPTDKLAVRKPLTREQVIENAKNYKRQASKFINFDGKNPAEIRYNSEWLDKLSFKDIIELAANFTVQQLLVRDMFEKRIAEEKPIHLHEFLYPLMQGYDAVALDADVQIGGTDQTFNMLAGRQLMRQLKDRTHVVITVPLLEGNDGRKAGKSLNNYIGLEEESFEMYGKVMSLKDELIIKYFVLATDVSSADIKKYEADLELGVNPRDIKAKLAFEVVKEMHNEKAAQDAAEEFDKVFKEKGKPTDIPEFKIEGQIKLVDVLVDAVVVPSKSEVRRLISQGGVKVNDIVVKDTEALVDAPSIIQVGKRRFLKVV